MWVAVPDKLFDSLFNDILIGMKVEAGGVYSM